MKIRGKNYELVKVYKDPRFEEKDMLLCRSEIGYLECFHRFDLNDNRILETRGEKWQVQISDRLGKISDI